MGNKTTVEVTEQTLYNIDILEDETTVVTVEVPQDIVTVEISQFTVAVELYNSDNESEGQPVFAKSGADFTLRSFTDDDKTVEVGHSGQYNELIQVKLPDSGIRVQDGFVISTDSDDTANIVFNGSTLDINGVDDISVSNLTATNATITTGTVTTLDGNTLDYNTGTVDTLTAVDLTTTNVSATLGTITTGNITTVNSATINNTGDISVGGEATVSGNLAVTVDATVGGDATITGNISANNASITNNITATDIDTDSGTIDVLNVVTAEASDEFIGDIRGAVRFRAKAGTQLFKGDVVYVSGVDGNTPVVNKALASDATKMPAMGLVFSDVNENANVEIVTFGALQGLNTQNFSLGTIWVSDVTAGSLTQTKPTDPDHLIQNIGRVKRVHQSAGSIIVGGAGRTNDVPNEISILGNITSAANMSANNITITNDITTDDLTGNQATITQITATDIDTTTVDATTGNITTVNATDVNTTNVDATLATITTGNITTVNATDTNTTNVTATLATVTTGNITTVNATTVNTTDVNTTDISATGTISVSGDATLSSDVVVGGNLTVNGTTTTVNTETLEVADNNIVLNSNHTGSPTQNSGITVERGSADDAVFQWNETDDRFEVQVGTNFATLKAENVETAGLTATQATVTTGNITTINATTVNTTDVNTTNVDATQIDTTDIDVTNNITTASANITGTANIGTVVTTTANIPNLTSDNIDVNGGEIDGTPIGANSHTTGKFTTLAGQQLWISSDGTLQTNSTVRITPNNIFVDQIQSQGSNKDYVIIDDDFYPKNGGNLGTNLTGSWTNGRWTNVYSQNGDFSDTLKVNNLSPWNTSTNAIESFAHIIPDPSTVTNNVSNRSLGNGSNRWDKVWADEIDINEITGNTDISGSLIPTVDSNGSSGYDLGGPNNRWRSLYLSGGSLYIEGQKVIGSTDGSIDFTTDDNENMTIFAGGSGTQGTMTLGSAGLVTTLQDSTVNLGPTGGSGNTNVRNTLNASTFHNGDLEFTGTLINQTASNQNLEIRTNGTGYLHANVADFYVGPLSGALKIDETSLSLTAGGTIGIVNDTDITGDLDVSGLIKINDGFTLSTFNPYAGFGGTAMNTSVMGVGQESGWAGMTVRSRGEHDWGLSGYGIPAEAPRALFALQSGRLDGSSDDYLNSGDLFGQIMFSAYSGYRTGTEWLTPSAVIEAEATENHSSSGMGTKLILRTTSNGSFAGETDANHTDGEITIQGTTVSTNGTLNIDDSAKITGNLELNGNLTNNGNNINAIDPITVTGSVSTKNSVIGDFQYGGNFDFTGLRVNAGDTAWAGIIFSEYEGGADKPLNAFTNAGFQTEIYGGTPTNQQPLSSGKRLIAINGTAANSTSGIPTTSNLRILGSTTETQSLTNRGAQWEFHTTPTGESGTQTTMFLRDGNTLQLGNSTYENGDGYIGAAGGNLKIQSPLDTNGNDIVNTSGNVKVNDNLDVTGDLDVTGSLTVDGNATIGNDNTADFVQINARVDMNGLFGFISVDTSTANYYAGLEAQGFITMNAGSVVYVSDGDGGNPCMAFYDGTNWKRMHNPSTNISST